MGRLMLCARGGVLQPLARTPAQTTAAFTERRLAAAGAGWQKRDFRTFVARSSEESESTSEGQGTAAVEKVAEEKKRSRSYPTTPPKRKALTKEEILQLIADIEAGKILPIPDRPPRDLKVGKRKRVRTAPGGQGVTLPGVWNKSVDPRGHYLCELYDGIRVFWSGDGVLATRHGRKIDVPLWWAEKLPEGIELDGELWMGYKKLGKLTNSAFLLPRAWQKHQVDLDSNSKMAGVSKDEVSPFDSTYLPLPLCLYALAPATFIPSPDGCFLRCCSHLGCITFVIDANP